MNENTTANPHVQSDWFGFERIDFEFDASPSILVRPKAVAPHRPWIWRTEFFGHEPQFDLALLEAGWHVAYLQISDMYGAPPAIEAMHIFQNHLEQEFGLADKAVLEGMSRGGLYAFNYAANFPGQVAAIYLDNPVLDIRSWPGGLMSGPGDSGCWEQCLEIYRLTHETAPSFAGNPLDQIEPVAKASIPIILVCGDADEVVPYPENGVILVEQYQNLGAPLKLILKPGNRHHPHSVRDPKPLVEYLREVLPHYFNSQSS